MGDIMRPLNFAKLLDWVSAELQSHHEIFSIPEQKFFRKTGSQHIKLFGDALDTPIGPAAGPHTQLAQNIVAAYLCGSRFFELKTVQILDELEFPKPCIKAEDECYNTEWSTELSIAGAMEEYIKAWLLLHVLQKELFNQADCGFVFNMSVGYDLKGIKSPKVDGFIEGLKNASKTEAFQTYRQVLRKNVGLFRNVDLAYIEQISPEICKSITLSTLHGCPPAEIEAISQYLMGEKKLNTFVKMNPTLLGYTYVRETFDKMGYNYIVLKEESFTHDLQFADGVAMLRRLRDFSKEQGREFGVKLSNTLPVRITQGELPGDEMYMSGRALYPLTINLALKLAEEFAADLKISYSGGADSFNIADIFATGIRPITLATTLLKPGGYTRLRQIADSLEPLLDNAESGQLDLKKLRELADKAIKDANYLKQKKPGVNRKLSRNLSITDCFVAPCAKGCPIEQDIPEYVRLVGEGKHLDAFKVIVDKNPLPFITGTICNHKCMTKCTRLDYDESVQIRALKLAAAQNGYGEYLANQSASLPETVVKGAKAAVIGAGPSGLAAGYFLAKAGLDVTVFDKRDQAGGTVRYVIPDFRISRKSIENDVELVRRAGVKFEFGVNPKFSIDELMDKGFKYVYLAIGAGKNNSVALTGDLQNVKGAIPFLEEFNRSKEIRLGKNVAVIGGGNSAMDAARAALKVVGVEQVYIVYRRTKEYMPADAEELALALEDGVILKELLAPVALREGVLKCERMELGEPDASGRRSPKGTGTWVEIPVDTVLSATGEQVDYELLRENGIAVADSGNIVVNPQTLETNLTNVFIGGDALYGPATVVEGIANAAKACEEIAARENAARERVILPEGSVSEQRVAEILGRKGLLKRSCGQETEAERCLDCNAVCNVCTEVCPNRANISLMISTAGLVNHNQILHIDGMCNECGNCASFCPNTGAPYKDKLTLFWSEADFANSTNPGFLLMHGEGEPLFKVRLNDSVCKVKFDSNGTPCVPIDDGVAAIIWSCFTNYKHLF